ncbi:MAG TPA: 50S ribosomal protein L11 methyltransferase [Chloroflexia bacterium]|nr:50S ribosomal protein L11 methyltransferase [Chloroflexia bacterium]
MFYAYSRFHKPKDFAAARAKTLAWAASQPLQVFLAGETPENKARLETRTLSPDDISTLETLIDDAWKTSGFGGYTSADESNPDGFCYFWLDEGLTQARLLALLEQPGNAFPSPLQSPALLVALTDLLRETPHLEEIHLPFAEATPEDEATLAALDLAPAGKKGQWRVVYDETHLPEADRSGPDVEEVAEEVAAQLHGIAGSAPQTWLELSVRAEPEAVEAITELFARYGYNQGVVIEEDVQPGPDGGAQVDPAAPVIVRTYVPTGSQAEAGLDKLREGLFYLGKLRHIEELQVSERREEDWANAWKEFYQVHRVGRRSVIKPPWQEYTPQPDDILIEIDPGMAFGTGLHPTTRLCLQLLEDHLDPAVHRKVLDLGTGSGILAIASARIGVPYTLGVDTDEVAVRAAHENVVRNGLEAQIQMEPGSLAIQSTGADVAGGFYSFSPEAQKPPEALQAHLPFDAVIANIIARILIALAEPMAQALRPGGLLITSGIITEKADEVAEALEAAGMELVERRDENDWTAFAHKRKS